MPEDSFLLGGRYAGSRRPRFTLLLVLLMLLSAGLLMLSRLDHSYVRWMRVHLADAMAPTLSAMQSAVVPFQLAAGRMKRHLAAAEEHERLKRDVQELESWKWRARELEKQVQDLARANRLVIEPAVPFATARVVASSTGAFAYSAVIAAGRAHGLKAGYPVVNADGLVGRIVETGDAAARVLLVTDPASRVPVEIGDGAARAIVSGDGRGKPRLVHMATGGAVPKAGDAVLTSGVGGIYPRGLRVGTVVERADGPRVRLHADTEALDYLSILFVETPALELTDAMSPSRRRRDIAGRVSHGLAGEAVPGGDAPLKPRERAP